jgi:hypothetical protein
MGWTWCFLNSIATVYSLGCNDVWARLAQCAGPSSHFATNEAKWLPRGGQVLLTWQRRGDRGIWI